MLGFHGAERIRLPCIYVYLYNILYKTVFKRIFSVNVFSKRFKVSKILAWLNFDNVLSILRMFKYSHLIY